MPEKRELVEVFKDTLRFCEEDSILSNSLEFSKAHTKVYPEYFSEEVNVNKQGIIRVVKGRTLQTALTVHKEFPAQKIAVLNFAASQHTGGGVWSGSKAQEESLCRSSTLYPTLKTDIARKDFYDYHENGDFGYKASDRCIYSPEVIICKDDSDEIPERLKPEEFLKVDVVTCAAPHIFHNVKISDDALYSLHAVRAKNILRVCAYNGIDIFIGGAFGCGAFHNPPEIVASAWHEALKGYAGKFELVVFAIYTREDESDNWKKFSSEFAG